MELEISQERVEKMVLATYDSFNLVNELKAKGELNEEDTAILNRNIEHIRYVMGEVWFTKALTPLQVTELQAI